jgi:hypothetical protein
MLIRRCLALWILRRHGLGCPWVNVPVGLGPRQGPKAAPLLPSSVSCPQKPPPMTSPDQSYQRPRSRCQQTRREVAHLAGGIWGCQPACIRGQYLSTSEDTQAGIFGIRWGSHAPSTFVAPEPAGSSQLPWQELIGRTAPPPPHIYPWQCTAAASGQRGGAA